MAAVPQRPINGPLDLLSLFTDGRSEALAFGETDVSAMPVVLARIPNDLGGALLTLVYDGDLELVFDEIGKLGAVNFGFADGDLLADPVLEALAGEPANGPVIGGRDLKSFVRLADFAAGAQSFGSFELTGRTSDGWLRLTATSAVSSVRFEFLSRAANAPAGGTPDYFLYGISVVSVVYEARLTSLMNSQYGETHVL